MAFPDPGEAGRRAKTADLERDRRIWHLRMDKRMTFKDIGSEMGISPNTACKAMERMLRADDTMTAARDEMIRRSAQVLDSVHRRLEELAEKVKDGAPVAAGKDGFPMVDPATGAVVRDYSGLRAVLADIRATDNDIAKRWGLNAPDRLEATVKGTVRYEIVDVAGDELT